MVAACHDRPPVDRAGAGFAVVRSVVFWSFYTGVSNHCSKKQNHSCHSDALLCASGSMEPCLEQCLAMLLAMLTIAELCLAMLSNA